MGDRASLGLMRNVAACVALGCYISGVALAQQDNGKQGVEYAEHMPLADEVLVLDAKPTDFGAVAVGIRGHVLLSTDYSNWRQADSVPTRVALTGVDFVGEQGWAVGHDAVILHSTDGGESWQRQHFAPEREQPFLDVLFLDSRRGFAIGAYGLFMRTTDGGDSWQESQVVATDDWHLNAITQALDGALYIAAEQGIIYRSADGGSTWSSTNLPYQGSMFDIQALPNGDVLTHGLRGRAFKTSDGGDSWQAVDTGTESSLHGGRVLDDGKLVVVGSNGVILEREPGTQRFRRSEHSSDEPLAGALEGPKGALVYYGLNGIGAGSRNGEEP